MLKGALSGVRHFFATENLLKLMKNAFYLSSFCSRDIYIFGLAFLSCLKTA